MSKSISIILLGLIFLLSSATIAQPKKRNPEQRLKELKITLSLNNKQVLAVKNIYIKMANKTDKVMNNSSLTPDERRSKMKKLRDNIDTQIISILSPIQIKKYKKMKQNRPARRKNARN